MHYIVRLGGMLESVSDTSHGPRGKAKPSSTQVNNILAWVLANMP